MARQKSSSSSAPNPQEQGLLADIAEYPDDELAFKARVKIQELGLFFLESTPVFPVETYLKALREEKVPAFA